MSVYRISKWRKYFECAQARKVRGRLVWMKCPTHDSAGLRWLIQQRGGMAAFGVFVLLAEIANDCEEKGLLYDKGRPLVIHDFVIRKGGREGDYTKAIELLIHDECGFLHRHPTLDFARLEHHRKPSELPEEEERATTVLPAERVSRSAAAPLTLEKSRVEKSREENEVAGATSARTRTNRVAGKQPSPSLFNAASPLWGKPPIQLDIVARRWLGITPDDRANWADAYPAVVVDQELAKAVAWCLSNPSRGRKSNYAKFLTGWLTRAQDDAGRRGGGNGSPLSEDPNAEARRIGADLARRSRTP